jgi:hypothetical protein
MDGLVTVNWTGASGPIQVQKSLKLHVETDLLTGSRYVKGDSQDYRSAKCHRQASGGSREGPIALNPLRV